MPRSWWRPALPDRGPLPVALPPPQLDDPEQQADHAPYGRPRTGNEGDELVPFPPNDPAAGDTFAERVKALLRRHVVERCIYGVDINPLAVELARVSLWVETLDPELPFSFLDHKIKVGNSLVGCWLDRVEDYPLKAWEREGGDGKDGARTQRIEDVPQGREDRQTAQRATGASSRRCGSSSRAGSATPSAVPRDADHDRTGRCRGPQRIRDAARPADRPTPTSGSGIYREHVRSSPALHRLKQAMDEWCAVWFWPTDEESLRARPDAAQFPPDRPSTQRRSSASWRSDLRFFHWEFEFPDVFTPERSGFDAMIGNPPWDVMKPNSQEFFTDYDPLYRTYDKQAALRRQDEAFRAFPSLQIWDEYNAYFKAHANWARNVAEPFDMTLARGKEGESPCQVVGEAPQQWRLRRPRASVSAPGQCRPQLVQDVRGVLLEPVEAYGRFGVILPTGIYSDFGTKTCGKNCFRGRLEFLYAFQNEKKIFAPLHHRSSKSP